MKKPLIVLIGGPSGGGKGATIERLIKKYPRVFTKMPSTTTRTMREGEEHGVDYYYITIPEFHQKLESGDIFEYTELFGNFYGMSHETINKKIYKEKIVLKDSDYLGVAALREHGYNVLSIYLDVPKDEVEKRLRHRGETEESIARRLLGYQTYVDNTHYYDYMIPNCDLDECVERVYGLIIQQR